MIKNIISVITSIVAVFIPVIVAYFSYKAVKQAKDQAEKNTTRASREDRVSLLSHIDDIVTSTNGTDLKVQLIQALSYENHDDPRWELFPEDVIKIKRKTESKLSSHDWNSHSKNNGMSDLELLFRSLKQQMNNAVKETYKT